ncbi:hypothetical protein GALL_434380 [mine drainage metagenome]|uniref:Uncharacterized protein n=1 Tax=mine drainage metagenome TaxID=410659 RepID=A0A1J5Q4U6_9ZZZZ
MSERGTQRGFEQGGFPVVGQAACRARLAPADVGCSQFHQTLVEHKRPTRSHAQAGHRCRVNAGQRTALSNQPNDLLRQRIMAARGGGGFGQFAANALRVNHADGNLGATNVNTSQWRTAGGQFEILNRSALGG